MRGSMVNRALVGASFALLAGPLSPSWGPVVWWRVTALQLGIGFVTSWRRMGLPYATAFMVIGAMSSGMMSLLAIQGHQLPFVPCRGGFRSESGWVPRCSAP